MIDYDRMRIEKWMWVASFSKTRSLAATPYLKIKCNGEYVKPARDLLGLDHGRVGTDHCTVSVRSIQTLAEVQTGLPPSSDI